MEYIILFLIAVLFLLEQMMFIYTILGRPIVHLDAARKIAIVMVILGEVFLVLVTKSLDMVLAFSYILSGVLVFSVFETRLLFWLRDYFFAVFGVLILEISFLFLYTKLGVSEGEKVTLFYSVTILLLLGIINFVQREKKRSISTWSIKIWLPFLIFLGTGSILFSLYTFLYSSKRFSVFSMQAIMAIGFGIETLAVVWLFVYLIHSIKCMQMQNKVLEEYSIEQRNYFLMLLQREEETRKFRHDLLNHMLQLQFYKKKKMYDELGIYLTQLMGDIQSIPKKKFTVGNDIVDVILNYYLMGMKHDCNVTVEGMLSNELAIVQTDLCTLSANLIKNAVEAAETAQNPWIHVVFQQGKKFLRMQIENTYGKKPMLDGKGNLVTTKKDKKMHGYGTQNIKRIVKKYYGEYKMTVSEKQVTICVFVEINGQKEANEETISNDK